MRGQTLIEAILAIGLITILISGITVVATSSLNNASYGKNEALATEYAQEGMETLRQIRNSDYSTFAGYNNTYCLAKGAVSLGAPSSCTIPNVDNFFIRSVKLENSVSPPAPPPGYCAFQSSRATVTVSWTDNRCSGGAYCHIKNYASCLSTSNPIQSP